MVSLQFRQTLDLERPQVKNESTTTERGHHAIAGRIVENVSAVTRDNGIYEKKTIEPLRQLRRSARLSRGLHVSICDLMAGRAVLKISRNAVSAGLCADLSQVARKGISADFGVIGRMAT
jgi:hypothetical protein